MAVAALALSLLLLVFFLIMSRIFLFAMAATVHIFGCIGSMVMTLPWLHRAAVVVAATWAMEGGSAHVPQSFPWLLVVVISVRHVVLEEYRILFSVICGDK
jgi:hypothetical protein